MDFQKQFNTLQIRRDQVEKGQRIIGEKLEKYIRRLELHGFEFYDFKIKDVLLTNEEKNEMVEKMTTESLRWHESDQMDESSRKKLKKYLKTKNIFEVQIERLGKSLESMKCNYESLESFRIREFLNVTENDKFTTMPQEFYAGRIYATKELAKQEIQRVTLKHISNLEEGILKIREEQRRATIKLKAIMGR